MLENALHRNGNRPIYREGAGDVLHARHENSAQTPFYSVRFKKLFEVLSGALINTEWFVFPFSKRKNKTALRKKPHNHLNPMSEHHEASEHDHELHQQAFHAHREAAHHFELAAKHHLLAAEADEKDDAVTVAHQSYIAYGHAIHAMEFAEEAALEDLAADEDDEDHGHEEHADHSHHEEEKH